MPGARCSGYCDTGRFLMDRQHLQGRRIGQPCLARTNMVLSRSCVST